MRIPVRSDSSRISLIPSICFSLTNSAIRSIPRRDGRRFQAAVAEPVVVPVLQIHGLHDGADAGEVDGAAETLGPGAAVHEETSYRLFADAAHALVDGGELWVVANSHLMYRPVLERIVGPTRQAAKTPKFTVFVSTRRRREY